MKATESFSFIGGSLALLGGIMMLFGGCMGPKVVEPNTQVSLSYVVTHPETREVILTGEAKDYMLDFTGSALYQLLEGAKKDEIRTETLIDPFVQHDATRVQKQTAVVLNEIGIPLTIGETLNIAGKDAVISDIVMENGIEQAIVDMNPVETIFPLEWTFTITDLK